MKELLDKLLLSSTAVDDFYNEYNNNQQFNKWINQILPEVEKCEQQRQNNPWHKYNVLSHILHSVEEMNKQSVNLSPGIRKMLAYVMFLHDIGKPECHIERMKDGKKIDSFFNHNIASEKIAKRVLPQLGFSEKEVKTMAKLVYKHDIFMFIRVYKTENKYWRTLDDNLIKDEISDLNTVGNGETLLRYLVMVGRADNLAQNEKKTSESLALLDKFDERLDRIEMKKDFS